MKKLRDSNNTSSDQRTHDTDMARQYPEVIDAKQALQVKLLKRALTLCLFGAMGILLWMLVQNLHWSEVKLALQAYQLPALILGLVVTLISYLVFSSYDILGRSYTGHPLPVRQILPVAFVCYAFNINLSSWIGGVALRYRLYSRLGLKLPVITRIISLSVLTNSLGYVIVAGIIFSLRLVKLPANWELSATALQWVGVLLLFIAIGYLAICRFSRRRSWRWFKYEVTLPSLHLALAQALLATFNWLLMGWLIFLLLPPSASYSSVLGLLLISGIAGMIAQIPAGLGVLEAVFITLLQHQFSTATILAALIAYRVLYFLIPLALACLIYLVLEGKAKKWVGNTCMQDTNSENSEALMLGQAHCRQIG